MRVACGESNSDSKEPVSKEKIDKINSGLDVCRDAIASWYFRHSDFTPLEPTVGVSSPLNTARKKPALKKTHTANNPICTEMKLQFRVADNK